MYQTGRRIERERAGLEQQEIIHAAGREEVGGEVGGVEVEATEAQAVPFWVCAR
ncbi:MAG: hypothetical protein U5N10_13705 [Gemmobacter sp.]|nr:hypothetical protein [Gemmobacter sp.]